jgi:hypothetical protein
LFLYCHFILSSILSVQIFIRLLPDDVSQSDLRHFVSDALHRSWFVRSSNGQIVAVEIRKLTNSETYSTEYHGIVDVEPAKAAMQAIQKLNRNNLKGKDVEVRKFFQRSDLRDRRRHLSDEAISEERRKRDRRRSHMQEERVHRSGALGIGYLKEAAARSRDGSLEMLQSNTNPDQIPLKSGHS